MRLSVHASHYAFWAAILLFFLSIPTVLGKDVTLNPPLESLPDGEFIPVVLDQSTLRLYWIAPEKNIRNGVHSLIVRKITGQTYGEIDLNKDSKRFIVGGFIKTDGKVLNFHGRNSFNSTTFNPYVNENKLNGILELAPRKKLLDYIRVEFPNAVFRADVTVFKVGGTRGYSQEQQDKLADAFAWGWAKHVESYNDPKEIEAILSFVSVKRFALACKSK